MIKDHCEEQLRYVKESNKAIHFSATRNDKVHD
jgi:hypothetical protein